MTHIVKSKLSTNWSNWRELSFHFMITILLHYRVCLPSSSLRPPPASSGVHPKRLPSLGGRAGAEVGFCPRTDQNLSGSIQMPVQKLACSSPSPPNLRDFQNSVHTDRKTQKVSFLSYLCVLKIHNVWRHKNAEFHMAFDH